MILQRIGTRKIQIIIVLQDQDMALRCPIKDALLYVNHPYRLILPFQVHKVSAQGYHIT